MIPTLIPPSSPFRHGPTTVPCPSCCSGNCNTITQSPGALCPVSPRVPSFCSICFSVSPARKCSMPCASSIFATSSSILTSPKTHGEFIASSRKQKRKNTDSSHGKEGQGLPRNPHACTTPPTLPDSLSQRRTTNSGDMLRRNARRTTPPPPDNHGPQPIHPNPLEPPATESYHLHVSETGRTRLHLPSSGNSQRGWMGIRHSRFAGNVGTPPCPSLGYRDNRPQSALDPGTRTLAPPHKSLSSSRCHDGSHSPPTRLKPSSPPRGCSRNSLSRTAMKIFKDGAFRVTRAC